MASEGQNRNKIKIKRAFFSILLERAVRGRRKSYSRERVSNFSLDFPAIGPSVSEEARSKVAPHGKSYLWAPVLWSFNKIRKVWVFSYLIESLFKSLVNDLGCMRS